MSEAQPSTSESEPRARVTEDEGGETAHDADEIPPLPTLEAPTDGPGGEDALAQFESTHHPKRFRSIRAAAGTVTRKRSTLDLAYVHDPQQPESSSAAASRTNTNISSGEEGQSTGRFRAKIFRQATMNTIDSFEPIVLDDSKAEVEPDLLNKDTYRWAVVIENQRGAAFFGSHSYSSKSLLPSDPPPYLLATEPDSKTPANDAPTTPLTPTSLTDYQLPDASWIWVSKNWLVQIDGDGASHDGYEYNWWFRKTGWRAYPGRWINYGGWVRRRRWVRLMMRPAGDPRKTSVDTQDRVDDDDDSEMEDDRRLASIPSLPHRPIDMRWSGVVETDWNRARHVMHSLGTDGQRIALWREWLTPPGDAGGGKSRDENAEDREHQREKSEEAKEVLSASAGMGRTSSKVSRRALTASEIPDAAKSTLSEYADDALRLLVFPESRLKFVSMVSSTGVGIDSYRDFRPEFFSSSHKSSRSGNNVE